MNGTVMCEGGHVKSMVICEPECGCVSWVACLNGVWSCVNEVVTNEQVRWWWFV